MLVVVMFSIKLLLFFVGVVRYIGLVLRVILWIKYEINIYIFI